MGKQRGTYRAGILELDEPLDLPEGAVVEVEVSVVSPGADPFSLKDIEVLPAWATTTAARLREVLTLPANWDSYHARRIDHESATSLWNLLKAILSANAPTPAITPTARGGVHAEWNVAGLDLEIEVVSPQQFVVLIEDSRGNQALENAHGFSPREFAPYVERLIECE